MNDFSSLDAGADFNRVSWAYVGTVCFCNAMGARLSCDRATIHGAVEYMKAGLRSALFSDRSLSAAAREAQLRSLDFGAHAAEDVVRRIFEASGLLR